MPWCLPARETSGSAPWQAARRITIDEGTESHARFSPDGRWLAFTAQYDGGDDVYLMPVEGGLPKRLTWDTGRAEVCGWTPDGNDVLFRSRRDSVMSRQRDFLVSVDGGLARPLPMPQAGRAAFSPDGKRIAYTPYAMESHHWKRYQGGLADDVWICDPTANTYTRITDWPGSDMYPAWAGNTIYFVSDRSGEQELYITAADGTGKPRALTTFEKVWFRQPEWAPDSGSLVFGTEDLSLYRVTTGDKPELTRIDTSNRGAFSNYGFSPDSRFIAFDKYEDNRYQQVYIYDTQTKSSKRVPVRRGRLRWEATRRSST